jgi:hypothetical protein
MATFSTEVFDNKVVPSMLSNIALILHCPLSFWAILVSFLVGDIRYEILYSVYLGGGGFVFTNF